MKTLVIYHAGCWDGFCAAWLFHLAFPDAEFHAAHYGTEPPDVAGKHVYLVDFSYKRPVMQEIIEAADGVAVLDHHKTAEAELSGLETEREWRWVPLIIFDMEKSGGRLAWEYLYGRRLLPDELLATSHSGYSLGVAPWLVDYTEDRDLWRWKLPASKEINAALRSYDLAFDLWDMLSGVGKSEDGRVSLAREGAAILRQQNQIVNEHVRHAREVELDGHKVLSVNATVFFSEIAGELAKDRPFGVCYFDRGDGVRQYSLRSRDDGIDVSEIAKRHGGGGHRNASGYEERPPCT